MTETALNNPGLPKPSAAHLWWIQYSDLLGTLVAAALPWSTTAVGILMGLWFLPLIRLGPILADRAYLRSLSRPVSFLPMAVVALAVVGTLWADVPWRDRLHGISPAVKLLVIPFLLYQFEHSRRGAWAFIAFLASCALLMGLSWIVWFAPWLNLKDTINPGVAVKNYIDQTQEFSLCMVALAPFVIRFYKQSRYALAAGCAALALGFFANMAFVVSARAALLYVPVLLAVFAFKHLDRRASALFLAGLVVAAATVWFTSPYLRGRVTNISTEYQDYQQNIPASTAKRLEYWQRSLKFFAASPIFGNGTGSTMHLFEREAVGQTGLAAEVTANPHNQTLSVAVQWGGTGVLLLYAMWLSHLLLFRGDGLANWIGLLVVVQNIVSSTLNSHLFDFHEGWMYVLGVGIAGGMSMRAKQCAAGPPSGMRAPAA